MFPFFDYLGILHAKDNKYIGADFVRLLKTDIFYLLLAVGTFIYKLCTVGFVGSLTSLLVIALLLFLRYAFKLIKFPLTNTLWILVTTFLMFSFFLGNIWSLYQIIPLWDFVLHLFSGFMLSVFGYCFLYMLSGYDKSNVTNYGLAAMFVFLFCVASAGVWEIYEFSGDMLFGLNSQNGSLLDTMTDIIAGTLGSIPMIVMLLLKRAGKQIKLPEKLIEDIDAYRKVQAYTKKNNQM